MQRSGGKERRKAVMGGETDAEWIARGGHLLAKGSREQRMDEPFDLPNLNDSSGAWSPEHDLWREFFYLLIEDALGRSPAAPKPCVHCHQALDDGCYNTRGNCVRRPTCAFDGRTVQQCALAWFSTPDAEATCAMLGIELSWVTRWLERKQNEKASSDTRLPSTTGSAPETSGVVREIHSGEEA